MRRGRPLALVLVLLLAPALAAQVATTPERLKAAFIFRFPQFVEWPSAALAGRPSVDLCVIDAGAVETALDELAAGEQLGGRPLRVRHVDDAAATTCHVLYLPAGYRGRRATLRRLERSPVLTVGDTSAFLDEGGIVELSLVDNRIRFHIDAGAAERAGLRLSAQLLRLAISVRRGRS